MCLATAFGLVSEKGGFDPLQNIHPSSKQKNVVNDNYVETLQLRHNLRNSVYGASVEMG